MGRNKDEPFLLLLDEPAAIIDPAGKGCFFEFIDGLRRNITMVVVSHELGMASPFFTHVALVNKALTLTPGGAVPARKRCVTPLAPARSDVPWADFCAHARLRLPRTRPGQTKRLDYRELTISILA